MFRENLGLYSILVVIECKNYKKPVGIEKVDAFATKIEDVKANLGVMISNAGFDAGAIAQAKEKNIILFSHREANEVDWNNLFGPGGWSKFYNRETANLFIRLNGVRVEKSNVVENNESVANFSLDDILLDKLDKNLGTVSEICKGIYFQIFKDLPIGITNIDNEFDDLFCRKEDVLYKVNSIQMIAEISLHEYVLNLKFASGNTLNDVINEKEKYNHLTSEFVNFEDIFTNQKGRILSPEEITEITNNPNIQILHFDNPDKHKFFRLSVAKTTN